MHLGMIKYWIRRMLGSAVVVRRPQERPILIFSSRRSGSTLLQQVIHSQKGVNFVSEPLNLWYYRPARYWELLPRSEQKQFVSLDSAEEEEKLKIMFRRILANRMKLHSQWRWLDEDYSFVQRRLVVKILHANALIDWFDRHFDAHVVFLIRNPIATARSIMAKAWSPTVDPYLFNESFRRRRLGHVDLPRLERIAEDGSDMERYALEWCLVNLVPLEERRDRPWLTLTYEELICRPDRMAQLLAESLDLSDPGRIEERLARPSRSADSRSVNLIRERGSEWLIERSHANLDPEVRAGAAGVLDAMGVACYAADSPWPREDLCHFGPLGGPGGSAPSAAPGAEQPEQPSGRGIGGAG